MVSPKLHLPKKLVLIIRICPQMDIHSYRKWAQGVANPNFMQHQEIPMGGYQNQPFNQS